MGTKETALASYTAKDRTQDPDDNIQMHHWHCTTVPTGPNKHKNSTWDNMRSNDTGIILHTPKVNYQTFAAWSFMYTAPTLWNQLLKCIRDSTNLDIFKERLKTHLFCQAFT